MDPLLSNSQFSIIIIRQSCTFPSPPPPPNPLGTGRWKTSSIVLWILPPRPSVGPPLPKCSLFVAPALPVGFQRTQSDRSSEPTPPQQKISRPERLFWFTVFFPSLFCLIFRLQRFGFHVFHDKVKNTHNQNASLRKTRPNWSDNTVNGYFFSFYSFFVALKGWGVGKE